MAIKVDIISSAAEVRASRIEGRSAAVIDVFRATSVMCTAMANGAKRIIPVTDIESCHSLQAKLLQNNPTDKILLGGERLTYIIEGFDLDNSPLAYTREKVEGATIIMSTTNGTRTINAAFDAANIYVASMLNATAVTNAMLEKGNDISLICSGRHNLFTMEDGLCAGYMAQILADNGCELTDYAWTLADLYQRHKENLHQVLLHCKHYNNIQNRLSKDVEYCLQKDILTIIPKIQTNEHGNYQEILL